MSKEVMTSYLTVICNYLPGTWGKPRETWPHSRTETRNRDL